MNLLYNLFAEADNKTWDLGRLQWFVGTVVFFSLSVYAYWWNKQVFDPVLWGTGFASVMAGGGAMLWMKGKEQDASVSDRDNR